jgi:hypothetical protein
LPFNAASLLRPITLFRWLTPTRQTVAQWRICPMVARANSSLGCVPLFKCWGEASASMFNRKPVHQSLNLLNLCENTVNLWKTLTVSLAQLNPRKGLISWS